MVRTGRNWTDLIRRLHFSSKNAPETFGNILYQQNGIYASIQFRIIGNLGHFPPCNFPARRYETQFADIYLNDGTLGHNAEVGVETAAGILLDTKDVQLEGCFELGVGNVGLLHAQTSRSDEPLVLRSLPGEVVAHEGTFGHHPLPCLSALRSRPHHLEHLIVSHRLDLGDRNLPLPGLLLALLLDGVTQDLGAADSLPIEKVGRHGALGDGIVVGVLIGALVVLSNRLAHGGLLLEPTLVVQLGTDSVDLLRELGTLMGKASLPLPLSFLCIEPTSVQLSFRERKGYDCEFEGNTNKPLNI